MLQSSGLANTQCSACLFEGPIPKHPNGLPGTAFWEAETKGPKTLTGYHIPVSETRRSRTTLQAMAGFDGSSGALNAVAAGADMSQQPLLTTPQHV